MTKESLIAELNQVLPKDEELFRPCVGSKVGIELNITNKDQSKKYVNIFVMFGEPGDDDEIRVTILESLKVFQVEGPFQVEGQYDDGFAWLTSEIFPHLEASVQSWAKRIDTAKIWQEEWPDADS